MEGILLALLARLERAVQGLETENANLRQKLETMTKFGMPTPESEGEEPPDGGRSESQ